MTLPPRGMDLLNRPLLNHGTAFTAAERAAHGLDGLLPPEIETLDQQALRAWHALERKTDDLERHIYLRQLQDHNEVLFYRLLLDRLAFTMPLVYTPVVAQACAQFSAIYRRPRGLFISYPMRDSIRHVLRNRPNPDVDVIVVTDGERVLGIGDQGVGGLGISIGKLSLYTLIGGIHPARTLPVVLDVGTNNVAALHDPEYLGWRHERMSGPDYDDFVDRFVSAVRAELPQACLQWEDFASTHARPILDRYRDRLPTFNDDIQGTAGVVLGALLGAVAVTGRPLTAQRVVMLGVGAAGLGVADALCRAMVAAGLPEAEARRRFWLVNRRGLLHEGRADLSPQARAFAQPATDAAPDLAATVALASPTILIGLSAHAGAFTEPIVRAMAAQTPRPIILPLSNPTERSEARPEDLLRWTDGRALVATGSPFPPVDYAGSRHVVSQCNNVYIFPALGLGVVAARARRVSDAMLQAAALTLGAHSPARATAALLPPLDDLRRVAREIAFSVAATAQAEGLAPACPPDELRARIAATQWTPHYQTL